MAILYRINSQSLAFEQEFIKRSIPFKIIKGIRFFDRKEIRDSLALLKIAINLEDDTSFLRVLDFLPLGIGNKSLELLLRLSSEHQLSLFQTLKMHLIDNSGPKNFSAESSRYIRTTINLSLPRSYLCFCNTPGTGRFLKKNGRITAC